MGGGYNYLADNVMWFAVKDENAHMLSDDVYDAFLLVPLYLGMYYKEDIHIHGCVSKRLYKNVMNYLQRILCDFSDDLSRINVTVDGFKTANGEPSIIGTGISCGVDSLTTIYDRYVLEDDPDYRINGLFLYNCGSHGEYGQESERLFFDRYALNKSAADELGLPVYLINSNLHAFGDKIGTDQSIGFLARYSCILSLQRAVKRYYVSSGFSYDEILTFGAITERNHDFAGFSESFSLPLIRTEHTELIVDGCQYERTQKTERISGWDIAQKHMNVCVDHSAGGHNCSKCGKCLRTLIALEAMDKLKDFAGVFDLETYRRHSFGHKCELVLTRGKEAFSTDNYNFAIKHGVKFPPYPVAWLYLLPRRTYRLLKKVLRKLLGKEAYEALKRKVKVRR